MFVGAMGSRRAQSSRLERLRDAGLESEELERLSAPVGLDLGARAPGETALSVLAEIIAVRHGRDGGRLRTLRGRIHETGANERDHEREDADLSLDVLGANA
jgi:xanthine dehydrogenase accessory factor